VVVTAQTFGFLQRPFRLSSFPHFTFVRFVNFAAAAWFDLPRSRLLLSFQLHRLLPMTVPSVFRKLLKAESTAILPSSEDELDVLFATYRVRAEAIPARNRANLKPSRERLELAAGILWFHTHVNDPAPALERLPPDQRILLVECFDADYSLFAGDPKWPSKLAGFFKFAAPSDSTPTKRAAPARSRPAPGALAPPEAPSTSSTGPAPGVPGRRVDKGVSLGPAADCDSEVEGGSDAASVLSGGPDFSALGDVPASSRDAGHARRKSGKKKKKSKRSKKQKRRRDSTSASSSSSDSGDAGDSGAGPAPPAWSLPARLDAFSQPVALAALEAQVKAACGPPRSWVRSNVLIEGLEASEWLVRLHRNHGRTQKQLREYDAYRKEMASEDRSNPLWIHRLSLRYSSDDGYELDAKLLASLAVGESPAKYAGAAGFQDEDGLKKYREAVGRLGAQWNFILQAVGGSYDPGQGVYGNFRAQLLGMYARRYALMYLELGGNTSSPVDCVRQASREVLAHSARQCLEIRQYLQSFFDDLAGRAGAAGDAWAYSERASFVSSRVVQVFGAAVRIFLESEGTAAKPGASAFGGAASSAGPAHLPQPSPLPTPGPTPAGHGYASWGPPPAYAPPAAPPPPFYPTSQAFAAPSFGSGGPSHFSGPAAPPYSAGTPQQASVPAACAPRAAKRGLQAAIDGAVTAVGSGGYGAGAGGGGHDSGGHSAAGGPARTDGVGAPHKVVRFDPAAVKPEPQDGGGGQQAGGSEASGALFQPSHRWILGKYAAFLGTGCLRPECTCYKKFDGAHRGAIGPHARWDCPLRFIAQCGRCPGFTAEGLRLRSAWIDNDTMTPETVLEWKRLIEERGLQVARGTPGPPRFP
jgi:hypothetical protein